MQDRCKEGTGALGTEGFAGSSPMAREKGRPPGPTSGRSVLRAVLLPASVPPPRKDSGRTPCRCRCGEQPAGDALPPDPAEPSRTQLCRPQLPRGLPARGEWATQGPGRRRGAAQTLGWPLLHVEGLGSPWPTGLQDLASSTSVPAPAHPIPGCPRLLMGPSGLRSSAPASSPARAVCGERGCVPGWGTEPDAQ